ncbi:MFS transporter [Actinacidiphila sp. bgisy167]|uniref:MFS transporter n=1 Tax=Actinacidiphila sp. bgisy167 TaxID=3413797 RepID=UPI003D72DBEF
MANPTITARRAPAGPPGRRGPRAGQLLGVLLTGQFMALLDVFIVNVAAPTIRTDLHASGAGLQMVVAGYTISYAVLLITGARAGDLWGHRRAFLAGLTVFTAASLACGLAGSTGQLTAFRLIQGAGSALMIPQVLSLIQRNFTGERRVRALGVYAAVQATGAAAGQCLGGLIVSADLFGTGWRPAFLVNVPIGLVLLVLAPRAVPRDAEPAAGRRRGLDLPGLVTLGAAVTLLTVPLVLGQEEGWPLWGWVCLGLSAVLCAVFALLEARLTRRGGAPLVSARVLRAPGMLRSVAVIGVSMVLIAGLLFAIALHLQSGLGLSALYTGLTFSAVAVSFGGTGLAWRRLPPRVLPWLAPGGLAVAGVSLAAIGMLLGGGQQHEAALLAALFGVGLGLGASFSPTLTLALGQVRPEDAADASGLLATVSQLGQLIGVATFGTLFLGRLTAGHSSAHAVAVTSAALAATAAAGVLVAAMRRRTA